MTVGNTFDREKFEAGKIYFLNTQKLSKNSLLVRGHDPNDAAIEKDDRQMRIMPDLRSHTIWDTIQNTIEDPDLTLYLVLDEAHRGMKEGRRTSGDSKPTIVKQLINGSGSVPGIPIVWGISATVQRFNEAMTGMQGRSTLPNVIVDPKKVQDSGLLKDTINLDVPDETGRLLDRPFAARHRQAARNFQGLGGVRQAAGGCGHCPAAYGVAGAQLAGPQGNRQVARHDL